MPRNVKLRSLPAAFEMMMGIQVDGLSWGEDCRPLARKGMVQIIEDSLAAKVDAHLLAMAAPGAPAHDAPLRRRGGADRRAHARAGRAVDPGARGGVGIPVLEDWAMAETGVYAIFVCGSPRRCFTVDAPAQNGCV